MDKYEVTVYTFNQNPEQHDVVTYTHVRSAYIDEHGYLNILSLIGNNRILIRSDLIYRYDLNEV